VSKISDVSILIPAYNPDEKMAQVVEELCQHFSNVLIVNDGSDDTYSQVFSDLKIHQEVKLLQHSQNKGKGAALKTGFRYLTNESHENNLGVITVDADGQHLTSDVLKIYQKIKKGGDDFFLIGVRDFSESVPIRSKFGNVLTLFMLQLFYGLKLSDSQTGLRYVPTRLYQDMLTIDGDKYEYELNCLLFLHQSKEAIIQLPINTVYIQNNQTSHFRPIQDSLRIYKVFFKFGLSSSLSFALDIAIFAVTMLLTNHVMLSTCISRVASGSVNFWINRNYVFSPSNENAYIAQAVKYLALWLFLMISSGYIVSMIQSANIYLLLPFKVLVDSSLFVVSYYVQKRFIFRHT